MANSSGLFWVASSDRDIATARAVLKSLKPAGVLDELGFLSLLSAFSDRLYPATSTVMTRARYYLFVPAIYRHIESLPANKRRSPDNLARDLQITLCRALMNGSPKDFRGIIGNRSKGDVARLPSTIYWTGLATLRIAQQQRSEASYQALLSSPTLHESFVDDDSVAHQLEGIGFWDDKAPLPPIFQERNREKPTGKSSAPAMVGELTLRLENVEARYLRDRFLEREQGKDASLLGFLLCQKRPNADYEYPWQVPGLPEPLQTAVHHAKRLSLLARGATILHEALLFKARREPDPGTADAFVTWWRQARADLAAWDLDDFAQQPFLRALDLRGDRQFLKEWRGAIVSHRSGSAAYTDEYSRALLRRREREVRGLKARLVSPYHLKTWQPPETYNPDDLYEITYRHRVAMRIIGDIQDGLARGTRR